MQKVTGSNPQPEIIYSTTYFERFTECFFKSRSPHKIEYFYSKEEWDFFAERVCTYAASFGTVAFFALPLTGFYYALGAAALCKTLHKVLQVAIGYIVYPKAAFSLVDFAARENHANAINFLNKEPGFSASEVILQRGPNRYSAIAIERANCDKWEIRALGNGEAIEGILYGAPSFSKSNPSNVLLVNGPSVGRSGGLPTPMHMSAAFQTAIEYVESKKPTHIALYGRSLGGGMMATAINRHELRKEIQYGFFADVTFRTLSAAAAGIFGRESIRKEKLLEKVFHVVFTMLGVEMDVVQAGKKMAKTNVLCIKNSWNSEGDGVISSRAALSVAFLNDRPVSAYQLGSYSLAHNTPVCSQSDYENDSLRKKIGEFFNP